MNGELQQLFVGDAPGRGETRRFSVLTRHGQPLLYFPRNGSQAQQALSLYPAQRTPARLARRIMRLGCPIGLTWLLPSTTLKLQTNSPLLQFVRGALSQETIPDFAVLAGNPNAPGRRFILLLFDQQDRPCMVVKAGMNTEAIQLLDQEIALLENAPAHTLGLPLVRSVCRTKGLVALALDFADGDAPRSNTGNPLSEVLTSWIDESRTVTAREVPAWKRLTQACSQDVALQKIRARVESVSFHPTLSHGDFAPWNIKESPKDSAWTVLDWERGELVGVPCWDWFHFLVQPTLLVDRLSTDKLVQQVGRWTSSAHLNKYARTVGVESIIRELLLAYLLYCAKVVKPSEGLQATRELLNVLTRQWNVA